MRGDASIWYVGECDQMAKNVKSLWGAIGGSVLQFFNFIYKLESSISFQPKAQIMFCSHIRVHCSEYLRTIPILNTF